MIILYILLIAIGALPLAVFLVNRKNYYRILKEGTKTTAQVTEARRVRYRGNATHDRVFFSYLPPGYSQYFPGNFITKIGKHRRGDIIEIYYLPRYPQLYAVPGSKGDIFMFLFVLLIFVFVVFACFKIHESVRTDATYEFRLPWKK
jgi:hypothetical protein